ncbi:hypothetical protein CXB51_019017 [Gossypium anomalum]|uniref:Uncharacterized protein n=1 Tax=Gossypium anomalum TaxID=47600 RepID=A0A8J5YHP2_9ROSI|nr:hypothetical protein CXB51_019017 [Gossypium anomalum]
MEVQYDKEDLGLILLCSLPPSYSTFRNMILYSRESLTVDEVYNPLTSYDKIKHLMVKPDSQGESLIARGRQDRNTDNDHGRTQKRNPRGKSKGRSKSSNRGKTCNSYKKKRHIKSDCYKLQNKIKREVANQKGKQPENFGEVDTVEDYSDGELLVASVNDSKVSKEWILDLGCTFHMSPNRDWFTTYEIVSKGVVLIGNNASCKIAGVGTIKVKIFDGVVRTLSDVRHVPELKRNLILLSTLNSKGYRYTAESGVLKISKAVAFSSLLDDDITKLWHMRLGHISENDMVELSKRGLLDGQGICKLNFYEHCVFGKQKRVQFTRGIHNTKGTFEYIHSNLWGPSRVPSRGGTNYMLTFIDDFSRKFWVFFLKQKSDIFGCPAYAHVDNGKLELRSIKCVFLGYKAGVKGYKLWCPKNRKVVISRDVVFDETAMLPNLSLKDSSNKENQKQKYAEADLVAYALNVAKDIDANREPSNYSEAINCEDLEKWMFAMQEEMESLHKNRTWDLVKLPKDKNVVRCKWVFKKKKGTPGVEEPRYKARLLDVKTAFLHGELEEDISMQQLEGFIVLEKEDYVCLLKKSLYGLKQSPRQWYKRFDSFMTSHDFKRSSFDSYVYFKKNSDGSFVYLLLYVDDMLIAAKDKREIRKVKAQLSEEFEMKDLVLAKKILGMEILRDRKASKLYLSQKGYI